MIGVEMAHGGTTRRNESLQSSFAARNVSCREEHGCNAIGVIFFVSLVFFVFFNDELALADQAELAHEMEARSMKDSMRERGEKIPNLLLVI